MKIKESNKSILFLLLIFVAILCMSIAYCQIENEELDITGYAKAVAQTDIYINDISLQGTTSSYGSYKTASTLLQIENLTLPATGGTATIIVNVRNPNTQSYTFTGISYVTEDDVKDYPELKPTNTNDNIIIDETTTSYTNVLNTTIKGLRNDTEGEMAIPITFKYKDSDNISSSSLSITIKLNFEPIESQTYELKTGKNLYSVIGTHYSDATKIVFCSQDDVPSGATSLGDAGTTSGDITAYWSSSDTTVYIAAKTPDAVIKFNEDSGYMFSNGSTSSAFSKVTSIEVKDSVTIDTSKTTAFNEMFKGCKSLTSASLQTFIDKFDTSSATNMCAMFGSTSSVTTLNVSKFDTSNVTDMSWMFEQNSSLTSITFGGLFTTENVAGTTRNGGMAGMFTGCTAIKELDLTTFDTANVGSMHQMFSNCSSLEKIYASSKFVTTGLKTNVDGSNTSTFSNCTNLVGGSGTTFDSNNTTAAYAKIDGGTSSPGYFTQTKNITITLDANGGTFTDGTTTKTYTGEGSVTLTLNETPTKKSERFSCWSTSSTGASTATEYSSRAVIVLYDDTTLYAKYGEVQLKTGSEIYSSISTYSQTATKIKFAKKASVPSGSTDIGALDSTGNGDIEGYYDSTNNVLYIALADDLEKIKFNADSSHMFSNGNATTSAFSAITAIEVENGVTIDTSGVTNFGEMFKFNQSLTNAGLQSFINKFDTSSATNMCAMFGTRSSSLTSLDLSNFNTANVTDMSWIFEQNPALTSIKFGSKFTTANVAGEARNVGMAGMFVGCSALTELDLSNFDTSKVGSMLNMFQNCSSLQTIYVSDKFVTSGLALSTVTDAGTDMFDGCTNLKGGNGTEYSTSYKDYTYAVIDTDTTPGYFTSK